jgi:hypothetical protein
MEIETTGLDLTLNHLETNLPCLLTVLASLDSGQTVLTVDIVGARLVALVDSLNSHLVNTLLVEELLAKRVTFYCSSMLLADST